MPSKTAGASCLAARQARLYCTSVFHDKIPMSSGQLTVKVIDPCGNADALATINIEIGNLATCVFINCLLSDLLVSDNTLLLPGMPRVFKVAKKITSNATIQNPETVIFKSGNSIELQSGFKVNRGAIFVAEIEGCTITFPSVGN